MKNRKKHKNIIEYTGWIGVVLIIGSYGLLALDIINSSSTLYHSLVFVGAVAVAVTSYKKRDFQPAVLNMVFACLAVIALARLLLT